MILKKILFGVLGIYLLSNATAIAAITNNGSEAVRVIIEKENRRTTSLTLNPGQKNSIPADAAKITVKPRGAIRSDVTVDVDIVANSGEAYSIEQYGKVLNLLEEDASISVVQGDITNQSNVSVRLSIFDKRNKAVKRRLYPGQSIRVPLGTTKVQVDPDGNDWGDETIKVEVDLPDGTAAFIESFGGNISFLDFLESEASALA